MDSLIELLLAIGDFEFKLPAVYTNNIFLKANPGFRVHSKVEDFVARAHTPPYLSCDAEIHHRVLTKADKYLILASDGLSDLYQLHNKGLDGMANKWVASTANDGKNKAFGILRDALGGKEDALVSRYLTVSPKVILLIFKG
jgi:pyruvate dehydrogenase phosphatase